MKFSKLFFLKIFWKNGTLSQFFSKKLFIRPTNWPYSLILLILGPCNLKFLQNMQKRQAKNYFLDFKFFFQFLFSKKLVKKAKMQKKYEGVRFVLFLCINFAIDYKKCVFPFVSHSQKMVILPKNFTKTSVSPPTHNPRPWFFVQ